MSAPFSMKPVSLAVLSAASGAALLFATGVAQAGIATTKHNLGSGTAANNRFASTPATLLDSQICVFCHTPHAAASNNPPLWNKALPSGTYTLYDASTSSTIDGLVLQPSAGGGSVSIACLSCHDGAQAMNNFINAPGSGGYNAAGSNMAGTWTAGTGTATPVNPATGTFAARTPTAGVGNLGTNLADDHPIGIQYCGGGPSVGAPTNTCRDPDFNAMTTGSIGGQTAFWVETGGAGRQKTDMILYNRNFPTTNGTLPAGTYPAVECATCHDPHTSNATFLRIQNTASAVCLTCHNK